MSKLTVAIYGCNGLLFEPVISCLSLPRYESYVDFPIKALTRSKKESTALIKYYKTDPNNIDSYKESLTNVDILINLAGSNFDPALDAAHKFTKLKLYIAPQFGAEMDNSDLKYSENFMWKFNHSTKAREVYGFKTIDIVTSLFVIDGGWQTDDLVLFGYNNETNQLDVMGDANFKMDLTYLKDVGNTIAEVIKKGGDLGFVNLPDRLRISSVKVSQNDILDRYEKKHNIKLKKKFWTKGEALNAAIKKEKFFDWNDIWWYLHVIAAQGLEKGCSFANNDNEWINPNENIFRWTRYDSI